MGFEAGTETIKATFQFQIGAIKSENRYKLSTALNYTFQFQIGAIKSLCL